MIQVTVYKRPDGRTETIDCPNVYPDDAQFFRDNNIHVSMEDIGDQFAVYADTGRVDSDGEPDELIELSGRRSCEETLAALCSQCKQVLAYT